jgi:hypothetical protein
MLGHRRLQIDARKWIASKLKPKKYGEKLAIGGGDEPLQLRSHVTHASAAALQRVDELLTRSAGIGSSGANPQADSNGPLLPVEVRSSALGHGASMAVGTDSGSPE